MSRADLCLAVWMHTVQTDFRNKGWMTAQGEEELSEARDMFRAAEALGKNIPSIAEACDYFSGR